MAAIYILAGLNHFRKPQLYLKIIPPYIPFHNQVNYISGFFETILGIGLCIPSVSVFSAWGIIVLLIIVFPANIFMLTNENAGLGLPKWMIILRLPIQIILIIWAYFYT
jgi:uncharacterized membrane protein